MHFNDGIKISRVSSRDSMRLKLYKSVIVLGPKFPSKNRRRHFYELLDWYIYIYIMNALTSISPERSPHQLYDAL